MDNNQMDKFLRFEKKWITFLKKKMDTKKPMVPVPVTGSTGSNFGFTLVFGFYNRLYWINGEKIKRKRLNKVRT